MKKEILKIDLIFLKECLDYDPSTGLFTWNKRPRNHFKTVGAQNCINTRCFGKIAGHIDKNTGYICIRINNILYLAHRLAWLFHYGYMPENQIDHKDRIRHHNWIDNLREASQQCQSRNSSIRSTNKSGVTGVSFMKNIQKWAPEITINGKNHRLGYYKSFGLAVLKRWHAEVEHNFPNCCTSSSAYNYLKERGIVE